MPRSLRTLLFRRSGALKVRVNGAYQNVSRSAVAAAAPRHTAAASVTINPAGNDNNIAYTADVGGAAGNKITIEYVISGTGSAAVVTVSNNAIKVTCGSATLASTVVTAVNAHAVASAMVTASASGLNTGVVAAVAPTALTGGIDATVASAGDTRVDSSYLYVAYADVAASSTAGWKRIALSALA